MKIEKPSFQRPHMKESKNRFNFHFSPPYGGTKGQKSHHFPDLWFITPLNLGRIMQNTLAKQLYQVALTVAVISAAVMAFSIGLGEAFNVVVSPDDVTDVDTLAVYGGDIDLVDRIATLGAFVWILGPAGLAAVRARDLPGGARGVITYAPIVLGLIGLTTFSTEVGDILSGDYVWANYSDGTAAFHLMLAASTAVAILGFFRRN